MGIDFVDRVDWAYLAHTWILKIEQRLISKKSCFPLHPQVINMLAHRRLNIAKWIVTVVCD